MTIDRRATIDAGHQARLDALADALTETVMQRLLADPAFLDRIAGVLHHSNRSRRLKQREALLAVLRAFEEAHDLPRSIPTRRDAA